MALNYKENLIVGTGNTKEATILNSSNVSKEPFEKQPYKTLGVNGKGKETTNVDPLKAQDIQEKFNAASPGDVMKVISQIVEIKAISIRMNDENGEPVKEAVIAYDNIIKTPVKAYSKTKGDKKFVEDKELIEGGEITLLQPTVDFKEAEAAASVLYSIYGSLKEKDSSLFNAITGRLVEELGLQNGGKIDGTNLLQAIAVLDDALPRDDHFVSLYREKRAEMLDEHDIKIPKIDEVKEKGAFAKRYNYLNINGIKGMEMLRILINGLDEKTKERYDKPTLEYIEQALEWKKNNRVSLSIRNMNSTSVGIDQNGMIVIHEDKGFPFAKNGDIYENGFNEALKPYRVAARKLENLFFNDESGVSAQQADEAIKTLADKALELAEKLDHSLKDGVIETVKNAAESITYDKLASKDKSAMKALNELYSFVMTGVSREFRKENIESLMSDLLTKDQSRVKNKPLASKFKEAAFVRRTEDEEGGRYYAVSINASVPTLSIFGDDLYVKEKKAQVVKVYISEDDNRVLDVLAGANLKNAVAESKLGMVLNAIAALSDMEDEKKIPESAKKLANYGGVINGKSTNFGILGVKKDFSEMGENKQKVIANLNKFLENLRDLLLKDPKVASAMVRNIKNGNVKEKNFQILGKYLNAVEETEKRNKDLLSAYYAARSSLVREYFPKYYNAESEEQRQEVFKEFKSAIDSNKKIDKDVAKRIFKNFGKLNLVLSKEMAKLNAGIAAFNAAVDKLNEGADAKELEKAHVDTIAKYVSRAVYATTAMQSFGTTKDGEVYLTNSWSQNFRGLTDGIRGKEIVAFKKVEFDDGREMKLPFVETEKLDSMLNERKTVAQEAARQVDELIGEIMRQKAESRPQRRKRTLMNVASNISFAIDAVTETEEAAQEVAKESALSAEEAKTPVKEIEEAEKQINEALDDIEVDALELEDGDIVSVAQEEEEPAEGESEEQEAVIDMADVFKTKRKSARAKGVGQGM